MPDKPDDRPKVVAPAADDPEPRIFLVVEGKSFTRPALETYFAEGTPKSDRVAGQGRRGGYTTCSCNPVTGTICKCNRVCTCNPLCSCYGDSCYGGGGGGGRYCSCVPVH